MNALYAVLRRFSIRTRMHGAIAIVLLLFGLVGAVGALGLGQLSALSSGFMGQSLQDLAQISAVRASLADVSRHEKQLVIAYEKEALAAKERADWSVSVDTTRRTFQAMLEGADSNKAGAVRKVLAQLDEYAKRSLPIMEQIQKGAYDSAVAADRMMTRPKEVMTEIDKQVDALAGVADANAAKAQDEVQREMRTIIWTYGGLLAVVMLVVVPLTLANSRSIVAPIQQAQRIAQEIAQGNLGNPIVVQGSDEAAQLMHALQEMQSALQRLVAQVRGTANSIQTASAEIASGNQDLSSRTEQTASNLQQTASSMEQLTGTVKQSAESASQANQLASSAAAVAERGGTVVSQVVSTMNEINASSKKIADIIGVIDGIAFQTNILALNAAVEAARAGEQGRGFAVVAGEVRSLAQRSAEAAKEIKSLIGSSVDRVEAGSKLVADAGKTMSEIVGSVKRVSDIIGEITAAANEQSQGIGQVNTAVTQLDQMTQQNAALVEQSAAAAESLKDQASSLQNMLGGFRLGIGLH